MNEKQINDIEVKDFDELSPSNKTLEDEDRCKQTAVEYIEEYLRFKGLIVNDKNVPQALIGVINQAKEMEKQQQDEFAIGFVEWFTSEKSEYSIMYGNQDKRFATFTKEYTTKQLLEQFKNK